MLKSYIFSSVGALQGAAGVIVQVIGAGVHAVEYIRQGWAGYWLTAVLLPLPILQTIQLEVLPTDNRNTY